MSEGFLGGVSGCCYWGLLLGERGLEGQLEADGVVGGGGLGSVGVVGGIDEAEALEGVFQPHPALAVALHGGLVRSPGNGRGGPQTVAHAEGEAAGGGIGMEGDVHIGGMAGADAVLEGILHEGDEEQGRHLGFGQFGIGGEEDVDVVGIAYAHELHVVADEVGFLAQGDERTLAVVEHVAHHLGEDEHGVLGFFGIDVDECMDVVERVHEEVRIDLILQILELLLQVAALEVGDAFALFIALEGVLHGQVEPEQERHGEEGGDLVGGDEEEEEEGRRALALGAPSAGVPIVGVPIAEMLVAGGWLVGAAFCQGRTVGAVLQARAERGIVLATWLGRTAEAGFAAVGTAGQLAEGGAGDKAVGHGEEEEEGEGPETVERAAATIDQAGGEQVVVEDEAHEEDELETPKHGDLAREAETAGGFGAGDVGVAHHEGEEEYHEPDDEVEEFFLGLEVLEGDFVHDRGVCVRLQI